MSYNSYKGYKIIYRTKDNRYFARFTKDKKRVCIYGKTQKECYNNLKKALNEKIEKKLIYKNMLLFEYIDYYIKTYKENTIKKTTLRALKSYTRNHLKVDFINKPMNKYSSLEINATLKNIKLSKTREECSIYIKAIFKQAFLDDIIENDISSKINKIIHERIEGNALTLKQRKTFLECTKKIKHGNIFEFYYFTGARKSELLNLKNNDIEKEFIRIPGTKTIKSDRYLPKFKQLENILNNLETINNDNNIFGISEITLKRETNKLSKLCGFRIKIKDLRTTFGTMCAENNISKDIIAKWLGHTTTRTTEKYYIKVLSDYEKQQSEKFNKIDTNFDTNFS